MVGRAGAPMGSSQGGHKCPKSVGDVRVQRPPGGYGSSGLGVTICAVDSQALQVASRLGG